MQLIANPFYDPATGSFSYVLVEPASGTCAIIDPVLGYDLETGTTDTSLADRIVDFVHANDLIVEWILETHVHADHLSAGRYLKSRFVCAQLAIGEPVVALQQRLAPCLGATFATDGSQFDRLLTEGDRICLGHSCGRVLATPGHTPGCLTYLFDELAFVGDAVFMPDFGTGRCDFPGGDPRTLYASAQRLFALPARTRLLTGHDYGAGGRSVQFCATVAEQLEGNVHLKLGTSVDAFASQRAARDATLELPSLMAVAVPFNVVAGTCAPGELVCSAQALAA